MNGGRSAASALLLALALGGCGGSAAAPSTGPAPATAVAPARAVAPMDLGGQRVQVLPVQAAPGLAESRDSLSAVLLRALEARDTRTRWITPQALRRSLARAPGYAEDPGTLPADPFVHHQEHRVLDPLAGVLRRYGALTDARLVLIPREARWIAAPDGASGRVRFSAAMVDSRSGNVIWYGEADGAARPQPDAEADASAAAALAARMLVAPPQ